MSKSFKQFLLEDEEKYSMYDVLRMLVARDHNIYLGLSKEALLNWKNTFIDDKDKFIKELLKLLRAPMFKLALGMIAKSRELGYDYPEFKAVEKSINAVK